MRELNSKQYVYGNKDYWWYNITSPSNLDSNEVVVLNLWDTENRNLVKRVVMVMNENWLLRINKASTPIEEQRSVRSTYKSFIQLASSSYILAEWKMVFII